MKINKRQLIMLSLSLVVCAAVYLNWHFLQTENIDDASETVVDTSGEQIEASKETEENTKTLGEAQYVSSNAVDINEYFTGSRLTRKQSKDEAIDLLEGVVNNESSSAESVEKANAEIANIAAQTELEGTVESLIKAKGFRDCVVFIGSDTVNVVVASEGLTAQQAAQINEIVVTQTKIPAQNIKIVEVKS